MGFVFCSWIVSLFLFFFFSFWCAHGVALLACLLAEQPGQEMWSSRSSSVEFVTVTCIRSTMTGEIQSTPWFLGKFHFSQFMRSWSIKKRWRIQSGTSFSSVEAHELLINRWIFPLLKLMSFWSTDGSFLCWSSWASDQQMDLSSVEAHELLINRWIFPLLKLLSFNQQTDLLSVEAQELWSSDGWVVNGKILFGLIVQAWDGGRGHRSWLRGESFQGWGDCWSGMLGEFMPNLRPMHTTSWTVLREEGLDIHWQGLWWHYHTRRVLHNYGLQTRVCNSYSFDYSDSFISVILYFNLFR